MAVNEIESVTTASRIDSSKGLLKKDDFLKIFVAQLQYQNPLDPLKPDEVLTQLSQISSVERLENIEGLLEDLKGSLEGVSFGQIIDLIGKKVGVEGNVISEGDEVQLRPEGDFDECILILVNQQDGSKKEVRIQKGESLVYISNEAGERLVYAHALKDGKEIPCDFEVFRVVRGINMEDGSFKLIFADGQTVDFKDIKTIKN